VDQAVDDVPETRRFVQHDEQGVEHERGEVDQRREPKPALAQA